MTIILTKIVPARRKTVKYRWIRQNWMRAGKFYEARKKMNCKIIFKQCSWCGYKFSDSDMLNIAAPEKSGNTVLCGNCADEALGAQLPEQESDT